MLYFTFPEDAAGPPLANAHIIGGRCVFEPPITLNPNPLVGDLNISTNFVSGMIET